MEKQKIKTEFTSVEEYIKERERLEPCLYSNGDGTVNACGYSKIGNMYELDKNSAFQLFHDLREWLRECHVYDKNGEELI